MWSFFLKLTLQGCFFNELGFTELYPALSAVKNPYQEVDAYALPPS